jgi:hypothetical protein
LRRWFEGQWINLERTHNINTMQNYVQFLVCAAIALAVITYLY